MSKILVSDHYAQNKATGCCVLEVSKQERQFGESEGVPETVVNVLHKTFDSKGKELTSQIESSHTVSGLADNRGKMVQALADHDVLASAVAKLVA